MALLAKWQAPDVGALPSWTNCQASSFSARWSKLRRRGVVFVKEQSFPRGSVCTPPRRFSSIPVHHAFHCQPIVVAFPLRKATPSPFRRHSQLSRERVSIVTCGRRYNSDTWRPTQSAGVSDVSNKDGDFQSCLSQELEEELVCRNNRSHSQNACASLEWLFSKFRSFWSKRHEKCRHINLDFYGGGGGGGGATERVKVAPKERRSARLCVNRRSRRARLVWLVANAFIVETGLRREANKNWIRQRQEQEDDLRKHTKAMHKLRSRWRKKWRHCNVNQIRNNGGQFDLLTVTRDEKQRGVLFSTYAPGKSNSTDLYNFNSLFEASSRPSE